MTISLSSGPTRPGALRARIVGTGAYLPADIVSNTDLAQRRGIEIDDAWIIQRTGITRRHIAAPNELTSDLAAQAARTALANAGLTADDVDLIIVATTTPDQTFPATATRVQAKLGMTRGFSFDVQAVCTGFVYALATADAFLRAGQARTALVIGAETFTRLLDWTDRTTCVLFGDGAGAVVLRAESLDPTETDTAPGILSTHLHSDGRERDLLYVDGGPGSTGQVGHVRMVGKEVFKHAVSKLAAVVDEALAFNQLKPEQIDWLVPHQANQRIIEAMGKKLRMPVGRVVSTVARHANTSAASIPLALAEAVGDGRIQPGQLVLFEAIGGGLTWGAALVRF